MMNNWSASVSNDCLSDQSDLIDLQRVTSISSLSPFVDELITTNVSLASTIDSYSHIGLKSNENELISMNTRSKVKSEHVKSSHESISNAIGKPQHANALISNNENCENGRTERKRRAQHTLDSSTANVGSKRSRLSSMQTPQDHLTSALFSHSSNEELLLPTLPGNASFPPLPQSFVLTNEHEFGETDGMSSHLLMSSYSNSLNLIPTTGSSSWNQTSRSSETEEFGESDSSNQHSNESILKKDPFSLECRIPLPGMLVGEFGPDTRHFVRKRNERERTRVRNVNEGFERLRTHLPAHGHLLLGCSNCENGSNDRLHSNSNCLKEKASQTYETNFQYLTSFDADGQLIGTAVCSHCGTSTTLDSDKSIEINCKDRRLSKVETLRLAIAYIKHLKKILQD